MIVGTKNISLSVLRELGESGDKMALARFAESLVPAPFRHISGIVENQKYYTALLLRKFKSTDYALRMEMCSALLDGTHIRGVLDGVYDAEDLLSAAGVKRLLRLLENDFARP